MEHKSQPDSKSTALFSFFAVIVIIMSFGAGIAGSFLGNQIFDSTGQLATATTDSNQLKPISLDEDSAVIDVVDANQQSVVSIIISRELSERERRFQELFGGSIRGDSTQVGSGSGFVVDKSGIIVTNRHVVSDPNAEYTVVFSDGTELTAELIDVDTLLDIGIIKVNPDEIDLKPVTIGSSSDLKVGQRVIAIGNSLGEFSGTVSYGIISGLSRSIIASDSSTGTAERLENVIQTDASINPGNSGGPLFDIMGNVIGVNVAVAQNAENIGFAIPIDVVKRIISDVNEFGEIRRPLLGVVFRQLTPTIAAELELEPNFGALIVPGNNGPGVIPDSAADLAGLQEGDIILSIDGIKLDEDNTLQKVIQNKAVGDKVQIIYYRDGEERTTTAILQQSSE